MDLKMNINKKQTKMQITYIKNKKSTFCTTSVLKADEMIARVEALKRELDTKITAGKEAKTEFEEGQTVVKTVLDKLSGLDTKRASEKDDMSTYLQEKAKFLSAKDKLAVDKRLASSEATEELFDKKISEEANSEKSSLLRLIRLKSIKEEKISAGEDYVENLINKSVEKGISEGKYDIAFQLRYQVSRSLRLKERDDFKQEEKKVYSESATNLSPIDFVVEQMQCAEPDSSDIDE